MADLSPNQVDDLLYDLRGLVAALGRQQDGSAALKEVKDALNRNQTATDKLILALAKLSTKLDGESRNRQQEERAMQRFTDDVNRAQKAQEAQTEAVKQNIAAAEAEAKARAEAARLASRTQAEIDQERLEAERARTADEKQRRDQARTSQNRKLIDHVRDQRYQRDTTRSVFEQFSYTGGMAERLKNNFLDLSGNSLGMQSAFQLVASAAEGAAKSLMGMSKALHQGERGAKVSARALTNLADPVLKVIDTMGVLVSALSLFVPGGILFKGAVALGGMLLQGASAAGKAALALNELAAEQTDALLKSFRALSTVGAAGARGLDSTFDTLQTLGMSVSQIEEFNSMITSSSQRLAFLGSTVADGANEFARVAGGLYKSQLGEQLEMLGYTAEEQREAALAYMSIQARTGRLQLRNTDQLIKESAKFARELDLAAQLTGQTRKEQAAAREAALAETRFRGAMIAARQTGDTERIRRLEAAQQAAALAKAMGDERGFTGILQFAAGGMTTPEAVAAEQTYRISEILAQPNISQIEMAQMMGTSIELQQRQLAGATALVGNIDALSTNFVATADFQERIARLTEEANRQGLRGPDALLRVLETEQGKRIAAGGDMKTMIEAGRLQQSAAMIQDSALKKFNAAADINALASKTFESAVKLFAQTVGVREPAGGTPGRPTMSGATGGGTGLRGAGLDGGAMAASGSAPGSAVTRPSGARVFEGGLMGSLENFVTQGRGFRSYSAGAAGDVTARMLDLIGRLESNGNYNVLVGGKTLPELTQMTVGEVLEFQKTMLASGHESTAVGKYQIINKTLAGLVKQGVVSAGDPFNAATQDRLAIALMKGRGLDDYKAGKLGADQFAHSLAMEWASLPTNTGSSYYQGVGSNKAGISYTEVIAALKGARTGGVLRGPDSGYLARLHGTEAVVPLPDGKKIPVSMDTANLVRSFRMSLQDSLRDIALDRGSAASENDTDTAVMLRDSFNLLRKDVRELIQTQSQNNSAVITDLMNQLVDLQRRGNSTREKLLQVSAN